MWKHALVLNKVLLFWFAIRAVNLFIFYIAEHSSLHTEARLLVTHLCDTTHNRKISGSLIDCNQARSLLNSRSFAVTYALEKTLKSIALDSWRGASHEIAAFAKLLGLVTTCIFTSAVALNAVYLRALQIRHAKIVYGETLFEAAGFRRQLPMAAPEETRQKFD